MTSKRQQTMSKMTREREVKARRARKLEKKYAAAAERRARATGGTFSPAAETPWTSDETHADHAGSLDSAG